MTSLVKSKDAAVRAKMETLNKLRQQLDDSVGAYFFDSLFHVIENSKKTSKNLKITDAAIRLAEDFSLFYHSKDISAEEYNVRLMALEASFKNITTLTKERKLFKLVKKPLQNISQLIMGLVLSTLGAIYGLQAGFFRGIADIQNPFHAAAESGFATAVVGGIAGDRLPKKIFNDQSRVKLRLILNRLKYLHRGLKEFVPGDKKAVIPDEGFEGKHLSDQALEQFIKQHIIDSCFADEDSPEQAFEDFLNSKQAIQVCTQKAVFNTTYQQGSIGHHALIRIAINDKELLPIEFGPPNTHSPKFVDQAEEMRIISGKQLFKMMVNHERMKHIQTFSREFMLGQYTAGDYDCRSYVDQSLQAVGLKRSAINRFVPKVDSFTGTKIHKPLLSKTCFFTKSDQNAGAAKLKITEYSKEDPAYRNNVPNRKEDQEAYWEFQQSYTGFGREARRLKIAQADEYDSQFSSESDEPQLLSPNNDSTTNLGL